MERLTDPAALFDDDLEFFKVYAEKRAATAIPEFRERYCARCQTTQGQDEEQRLKACRSARCGLRDPAAYEHEWFWHRGVVYLVAESWPISEDVANAINERVISAGCLTVVLVPYDDGSTGWDLAATNLRGQIHKSLMRFCSALGGHPIAPAITELDVEQLRRYRRNQQINRVQLMASAGMNQLAIVRATGLKRSTVQRWIKQSPATLDLGGVPKKGELGT